VLVVDDELKICEFLEELLGRQGLAVSSVQSATDALERIQKEPFNLVLTDLRMPGMDGFEFVSRLKALRPDLPTIMITGYATVETAVKALRFGVDDYVTKPFNNVELSKVVGRALETARMQEENRRLLESLQKANRDLADAKRRLAQRFEQTSAELASTRSTMKVQEGQLAVHSLLGEFVTTEHDLDVLLRQVLAIVNRRFQAGYSSAMLVEDGHLVVRACEGRRGDHYLGERLKLGEGVAG
jgi:DNA-binding response OmpR family regulator